MKTGQKGGELERRSWGYHQLTDNRALMRQASPSQAFSAQLAACHDRLLHPSHVMGCSYSGPLSDLILRDVLVHADFRWDQGGTIAISQTIDVCA